MFIHTGLRFVVQAQNHGIVGCTGNHWRYMIELYTRKSMLITTRSRHAIRDKVLADMHCSVLAGHLGRKKTAEKLLQ